jgi:predicted small lipoprotein YifL
MKLTSFSRLIAASLTLFFVLFLTACGQKGDLYLDKENKKETTALLHTDIYASLNTSIKPATI